MRLPSFSATRLTGSIFALLLTVLVGVAQAADYKIDTAHSGVAFKIKHMGINNVRGAFNDFSGTISFDPANLDATKVSVTIQAASVDTGNEARDNHLRTADFFEVEKYPTITFVSTKVKDYDGDTLTLIGDLTMHGVTKEIELAVTELGPELYIEERKATKRAAVATTKINRLDFGISTKQMLGIGELSLGDIVTIEIDLQLDKVEPTA